MKLYRITPELYLENYEGLGASYQDGARWNHKGHPVMYFALSPSVAMLEMANYFPLPRLIPKNRLLGIYELSDELIEQLDTTELPSDWNVYPHPSSTRVIGTKWLVKKNNTGLIVPSAATPDGLESIIAINPLHEGIKQLTLVDTKRKLFNERAFTGSNE
ncbi:RES domain-containing protein [Photobacterium frigidiphilum]|uniref:RES domain-containing protein n=1 Tax=Photobacterium frigidiphilum TaxID=264736 RepID=A0A2T3JAC1_9GAMM|nr:RES domain-containing protein [Photobacterium frigidiphilum]PSU45790.1 RES domain-containing protein [Photobacterium frigidiphilum]